jgi:hypothetical protein
VTGKPRPSVVAQIDAGKCRRQPATSAIAGINLSVIAQICRMTKSRHPFPANRTINYGHNWAAVGFVIVQRGRAAAGIARGL